MGFRSRAHNLGLALAVGAAVVAIPRLYKGLGLPMPLQARVLTSGGQALSPDELFARASRAVVKLQAFDAAGRPFKLGSGFFVSADGLLVTNFHVIQDASSITAEVDGRPLLTVKGVVAFDRGADLAIVQAWGDSLPFLHLSDALPRVGERVFAIGNPEGLTNTLSEGLISGVRDDNGRQEVQTSAAISHGSSGGPLLAADGTVVGVTSAFLAGGQNLNFAVPARRVNELLARRGSLIAIAAAWTDPADPNESGAFAAVWAAIAARDLRVALDRLADMQHRQAANPYYWWTLGCIDVQLASYGQATEAFRKAIQLRPGYLQAHLSLGAALESDGQYTSALEEYRTAARLDPNNADAFVGGAIACSSLGDDTRARELLQKAVGLDPKNVWSHRLLGRNYFNAGQYGPAVDEYERAVRLDDTDVETELWLGDAHERIEEYRRAFEAYSRAVRLDPRNAYGHLWIGWECFHLRDYATAATEWRCAAELDPNGRIGAFARENLRNCFQEVFPR